MAVPNGNQPLPYGSDLQAREVRHVVCLPVSTTGKASVLVWLGTRQGLRYSLVPG